MHDLVQEMGHYIVRGQHPNNPEKHSRVWKNNEIVDMCSMDSAMENNEIEAISFDGFSLGFSKLVSNMKKLRLLIMPKSRYGVQRVEGPTFISNELQYISYNNYYHGSSFPPDFHPTKLVVLKLYFTLQKELWQGYKRLPQLKELHLEYAENLFNTPDFDGPPSLEILKLHCCNSLEEIHPSLGYCNSLVHVFLSDCEKLSTFPTIISMKNLETLEIIRCRALVEFPEIQARMDSLRKLNFLVVGIRILPSSIGQYCTNLISLELGLCDNLKRVEGNFQALKQLENLKIRHSTKLEKLRNDLFSVQHFLSRLFLIHCGLEDGEIPCDVGELFNLTVLDLSWNNFSRLPFTLLKLTRLKALGLSFCKKLLEYPELPSSVDLFIGNNCGSLESIGGFYKNCKRLSQVYLSDTNNVTGAEGLLQCMLHGEAINHHANLYVDGLEIPKTFLPPLVRGTTCRLQLPHNWCNDFRGFLMCAILTRVCTGPPDICLKHEQSNTMDLNLELGLWKECENDKYTSLSYVSFDSLRHTTWWDSTSNAVSFSFEGPQSTWCSGFGVELVSRKDGSVITETTTDSTEFCEDKDDYTFKFKIEDDTKSALKISHKSKYVLPHPFL